MKYRKKKIRESNINTRMYFIINYILIREKKIPSITVEIVCEGVVFFSQSVLASKYEKGFTLVELLVVE